MEYVEIHTMTMDEYSTLLQSGWRRFGKSLFRPRCLSCGKCVSLRIPVKEFRPNRSQQRNRKANEDIVTVTMGRPTFSEAKLQLHGTFHKAQVYRVGWRDRNWSTKESFQEAFLDNPIPCEEWCYFVEGKMVGVCYVDYVPDVGLSAIYFFHDPEEIKRGLGIWNILRLIEECESRNIPHLYLGYWVAGCRSLEYKSGFHPHEILLPDGTWNRP